MFVRTAFARVLLLVVPLSLTACQQPASAPLARPHDAGVEVRRPPADGIPVPPVPQHVTPITGAEARELIARGGHLLDVRSAEDYAAGHLPGAIHIPVELVWRRYAEIPPGPIVVYGGGPSDNRSARARRILGAFGREAWELGAMSNW